MKIIVVGVTNVSTAEDAAHQAADLARAMQARLHLVSAVSDRKMTTVGGAGEAWTFSTTDLAESHVADLRGRLGEVSVLTSSVVFGDPAKALCSEAVRLEADVIVVGSRRTQGVSRVLGSVASDVLQKAPCGVFVAKTT